LELYQDELHFRNTSHASLHTNAGFVEMNTNGFLFQGSGNIGEKKVKYCR